MRSVFTILLFCLISFQSKAQWVDLQDYEFGESSCIRYNSDAKVYQIDISCAEAITDASVYLIKYKGSYSDGTIMNFLQYYKQVASLYFVLSVPEVNYYNFDFTHLNKEIKGLVFRQYENMFDLRFPVKMSFTNFPDSLDFLSLSMGYTEDCSIDKWPEALKTLQLESSAKFKINKEIPSDLDNLILGFNSTDISSWEFPKNLKYISVGGMKFDPNKLNSIPTLQVADTYIYYYTDYSDLNIDLKLPELISFRLNARQSGDDGTKIFGPNLYIHALPETLQALEIEGYDVEDVPIADSLKNLTLTYSRKDLSHVINTLPDRIESLRLDTISLGLIEKFPSGLKDLNLNKLSIPTLPDFPESLNSVWISQLRNLTCLPYLPDSLKSLTYYGTKIKCIPNENDFIKANANRLLCTDGKDICNGKEFTTIVGKVYHDINKNGVLDAEDIPIVGAILKVNGDTYTSTNKDGIYKFYTEEFGEYTFAVQYYHYYFESILPAYKTVLFDSNYVADTTVFLVQTKLVFETDVFGTNNVARPGMSTTGYAIVSNYGNSDANQITVKLKKPQNWQLEEASPENYRLDNDTIIWENVAIGKHNSKVFRVQTKLPATATILGRAYQYEIWVEDPNDTTPGNNYYIVTDTIRGSYDPNDKIVNHTSLTPENSNAQELVYTIRFQNTGTDTAFKVTVVDTIIGNLDPSSIRVLGASHDFTWEYTGQGIAAFTFDNILLPDSNVNEPASHGFVTLAVRANKDLVVGDSIYNRAGIYFDFNEPVITNKALTRIATVTSVYTHVNSTLKIYPNPAKDRVRVEWNAKERATLTLLDISGKVINTQTINQNFSDIDVSRLFKGMYLIQVQSAEGLSVGKLLVQ